MLRKAVARALWLTKGAALFGGAVVTLALVFGVVSVASGADGSNFILGSINNTATALSKLTANVQGPAMQVQNTNPGTDDSALSLSVQPGEAPLRVNSTGRVPNLNADRLDGLDSARLAGTGDSAYRGGSSICGPGGAPFTSTLPISVSKESLLFATARAGVQANGNANVGTLMDVELRNADNTTTLASTGFSSQVFSANTADIRDLVSEGVLKSGISSPSEAPFVLRPGVDYVLRMTVSLNGAACTPSSPVIWSSSLSYIQLGKP